MKRKIYIIGLIMELFIFFLFLLKKYYILSGTIFILFLFSFLFFFYKIFQRKGLVKIDYSKRVRQLDIKKVSVVIPNYNYANYIEKRMDSILNQTYPIYELIILDDCSTDNSCEIIENKIKKIRIEKPDLRVKFIKNKTNSGNVFKQWKKAFEESTGDYLWIAEADDLSSVYFLNVAMQGFLNDDVVLSYTESKGINDKGKVLNPNFRFWADLYHIRLWNKDFIIDGKEFLDKSLSINNSIVNASAVIFKKISKINLDKLFKETMQYKLSGDWYFYSKYLLYGSISYSVDSLNYHRVHENSVTNSTDQLTKFNEIISVQNSIEKDIIVSDDSKKLRTIFNEHF